MFEQLIELFEKKHGESCTITTLSGKELRGKVGQISSSYVVLTGPAGELMVMFSHIETVAFGERQAVDVVMA